MDAPWMQNRSWASGRIRGTGAATAVVFWIAALLANGLAWTALVLFRRAGEDDAVKVAALFCLLGLGLVFVAAMQTWRWLRFGTPVLELASVPGVIGGMLEGVIRTRLRQVPGKPVRLTLTCNREIRVKGVKRSNDRIDTTVLWQADRRVPAARLLQGPSGLDFPVRVQIPYGLPESDESDVDERILWRLAASCEVPGVDFQTEFVVPAFVTEASNQAWTEEEVAAMADREEPPGRPDEAPPMVGETPYTCRPTELGGTRYEFRLALPRGVAVALPLIGLLILGGSGVLYWWLGELGPFAVLPAALGALFLAAAVIALTFRSRLVIENGVVTVEKSVLAIPRVWSIPFSDVKSVRVRQEIVEGVEGKQRPWDIEIHRSGGSPVSLGASIRDRTEAERLAREIRQLAR